VLLCSNVGLPLARNAGTKARSSIRETRRIQEGETAVVLDAGEGILIKHGRASLRGLLKGKIDSKGFEADVRKLRKEWTL